MVCASRPAARLLRTAAPFELPGGYFGTTRPIIRLVVDPIIRVVLYYQPKADNPADNPAVSFVVKYSYACSLNVSHMNFPVSLSQFLRSFLNFGAIK